MKILFLFLLFLPYIFALKETSTKKEEVEVYFKIKNEDVVLKFPPKKEAADKMAKRVCLEKIKVFKSKEEEKECIDAMEQYLDMKLQEFLSGKEEDEDEEEKTEVMETEEYKTEEKKVKRNKLKLKKNEEQNQGENKEFTQEEISKIQEDKKRLLTEVDVHHFVRGEGEDTELHIILKIPTQGKAEGEEEEVEDFELTSYNILFKPYKDDIKETTRIFCTNQLKKFYGDEINEHFLRLCMAPLTVKIEKIWNFHQEKSQKNEEKLEL